MPFPNHPEKHNAEALVTPEQNSGYRREPGDDEASETPEAVVLCFSRRLMAYLTDAHDGEYVGHYYGDLYVFDDADGRVGVLGNFGIGAPTTVMLMEELVVAGVRTFLAAGIAGCLDRDVSMGEFVVCDGAIRDEGTSHHYVESARMAYPSEAVVDTTERLLGEREESYHVGPSWTTDAIYRETVAEVERYAAERVLTVEMEASAVFAVADYRDVEAGAMFVVSDYLGPEAWEPKFHLTGEDLHRLGDTAKAVLVAHLDR